MTEERVRYGCISCKRTKRTAAIDKTADEISFGIFMAAADLIEKQSAEAGVAVPSEIRNKLIRWGIKWDIFPAGADAVAEAIAARNKLD